MDVERVSNQRERPTYTANGYDGVKPSIVTKECMSSAEKIIWTFKPPTDV